MLSVQLHLIQDTSEAVSTAMAAGTLQPHTALTGFLLVGALAILAAVTSAVGRLVTQAVQLLKEAFRLLVLAALAGLVVAAMVILAGAELLGR